MTIAFVTTNSYKFKVFQDILAPANIELVQEALETPEIQSESIQEIAEYSGSWAVEKLNKPVLITDVGYFVTALHGFSGPFVKYVGQWFTPDDWLRLMDGVEQREVVVKSCTTVCKPGESPTSVIHESKGTLAFEAGASKDTALHQLFIPDGFDRVQSDIPYEKMLEYWREHHFNKMLSLFE